LRRLAGPIDRAQVTFADLLAHVISGLDRAGIPYMVTGSLASSYHGEPRATRDVDIVVDPTPIALARLVDDLRAADFYVDAEAAQTALAERTQFNAIGPDASKVDFIIRKDRPFSIEEFGRREPADLLGTPGFVATAEDLVIAKLEWAAATDSERQRRDVAGIVAVSAQLDVAYVEQWASALGVLGQWQAIREEARG
jgi:hypothetical protein